MYNLLNLLRRVSLFGSYTQNFQIHWKIILVMYWVQVFDRKDLTSKGPIFLNSAALIFKTKNAICLKIVEDWIKCNKFWTRMITFCLLILSMLCMESVHSCGLSDLVRILQECSRRLFSNWNSSYCNVASGQCKDNKRTSNLMSSSSIPISFSWFVYQCGRFLWIIFVYHTPCRLPHGPMWCIENHLSFRTLKSFHATYDKVLTL